RRAIQSKAVTTAEIQGRFNSPYIREGDFSLGEAKPEQRGPKPGGRLPNLSRRKRANAVAQRSGGRIFRHCLPRYEWKHCGPVQRTAYDRKKWRRRAWAKAQWSNEAELGAPRANSWWSTL